MACRPSHRAIVAPDLRLSADPESVELGPTAIGDSAEATIGFSLSRPGSLDAVPMWESDGEQTGLEIDAPALHVEYGGDGPFVVLTWTPESAATVTGSIVVYDEELDEILVEVPVTARVDPDGDDDGDAHPAAGGGDCDDQDPDVSSDAVEVWYDGIDQDCDGNDLDADGDGYDGDGGADCDDTDDRVYPGAVDGLDGVDEDCDGVADEDGAGLGSAVFVGLETSSTTGVYVGSFGLFLRDGVSVQGWTVQVGEGEATPLTHDPAQAPGPWLHLCGPDDVRTTCGVLLDPWPTLDAAGATVVLAVDGHDVDTLTWDASWGLAGRDLQLDSARAVSGENDAADDWCEGFEPGVPNTRCD